MTSHLPSMPTACSTAKHSVFSILKVLDPINKFSAPDLVLVLKDHLCDVDMSHLTYVQLKAISDRELELRCVYQPTNKLNLICL